MLAISARFDYSGTTISSDSNEWTRRVALVNQAEDTWKRYLSGQWSNLLTSTSLSTTAGVSYVIMPSDYARGRLALDTTGMIEINSILYPLAEYPETLNQLNTNYFLWIKGSKPEGFKLYVQPTPTDVWSIPINYYSNNLAVAVDGTTGKATLTLGTDSTKIPDPYFIVDWVVGELYLIDDEPQTKWQPYKQSAQDRLISMAAMDAREQNQGVRIKLDSEEAGYDIFNSNELD